MNTKTRTIQYKGYTITKAVLKDSLGDIDNGWDIYGTGNYYTAANTLREAKIVVDMLVEKAAL